MKPTLCVTALLMGDPDPDRLERSEALRRALPEPREVDLSEWVAPSRPAIGVRHHQDAAPPRPRTRFGPLV